MKKILTSCKPLLQGKQLVLAENEANCAAALSDFASFLKVCETEIPRLTSLGKTYAELLDRGQTEELSDICCKLCPFHCIPESKVTHFKVKRKVISNRQALVQTEIMKALDEKAQK